MSTNTTRDNNDGYYTGEYTAVSSFKWAQADKRRTRTIQEAIKAGYIASNDYEIKPFKSWTNNDMNEYNKNLAKSVDEYQVNALKKIDKKFGTNYVYKWEEITI